MSKDKVNKGKLKPRDFWIVQSWGYNGSGFQKNKKKILPRKSKYKQI